MCVRRTDTAMPCQHAGYEKHNMHEPPGQRERKVEEERKKKSKLGQIPA